MYTIEEVKKAFRKLDKSSKDDVLELIREYKCAISDCDKNYETPEIRRYYAGELITIHNQICEKLKIEHFESSRTVLLEAIK
jgi:GTP1/Obg family GTP-binding protein